MIKLIRLAVRTRPNKKAGPKDPMAEGQGRTFDPCSACSQPWMEVTGFQSAYECAPCWSAMQNTLYSAITPLYSATIVTLYRSTAPMIVIHHQPSRGRVTEIMNAKIALESLAVRKHAGFDFDLLISAICDLRSAILCRSAEGRTVPDPPYRDRLTVCCLLFVILSSGIRGLSIMIRKNGRWKKKYTYPCLSVDLGRAVKHSGFTLVSRCLSLSKAQLPARCTNSHEAMSSANNCQRTTNTHRVLCNRQRIWTNDEAQ